MVAGGKERLGKARLAKAKLSKGRFGWVCLVRIFNDCLDCIHSAARTGAHDKMHTKVRDLLLGVRWKAKLVRFIHGRISDQL